MIYRKVYRRMWSDAKFRALSPIAPSGQGLWLWLLSGPFTVAIPGLIPHGEMAMAERLGWSLKAFREAFQELSEMGLVKADFKAPLVWIPNALTYNEPQSPNVVKGWSSAWDEFPECELKLQCFQYFKGYMKGKSEAYSKAFLESCGKPSLKPIANQEQEQEQEQDSEAPKAPKTRARTKQPPRPLPFAPPAPPRDEDCRTKPRPKPTLRKAIDHALKATGGGQDIRAEAIDAGGRPPKDSAIRSEILKTWPRLGEVFGAATDETWEDAIGRTVMAFCVEAMLFVRNRGGFWTDPDKGQTAAQFVRKKLPEPENVVILGQKAWAS